MLPLQLLALKEILYGHLVKMQKIKKILFFSHNQLFFSSLAQILSVFEKTIPTVKQLETSPLVLMCSLTCSVTARCSSAEPFLTQITVFKTPHSGYLKNYIIFHCRTIRKFIFGIDPSLDLQHSLMVFVIRI